MPTLSESIFRQAARELAPMVATWRTIMHVHSKGPDGYCTAPTCGRPGYGTANWQRHPCAARALAGLARVLHNESSQSTGSSRSTGSAQRTGSSRSSEGNPSAGNGSGPNAVISAISPSSTRSTSSLNGRNTESPVRRR